MPVASRDRLPRRGLLLEILRASDLRRNKVNPVPAWPGTPTVEQVFNLLVRQVENLLHDKTTGSSRDRVILAKRILRKDPFFDGSSFNQVLLNELRDPLRRHAVIPG